MRLIDHENLANYIHVDSHDAVDWKWKSYGIDPPKSSSSPSIAFIIYWITLQKSEKSQGKYFSETYTISIFFSVLIVMTILLLDFFMVSLQVDIHMEFYSALKISKIYLQLPRANVTWWQWHFVGMPLCDWLTWTMTLAVFISIRCGTKPGERQNNRILPQSQAPRFICGNFRN